MHEDADTHGTPAPPAADTGKMPVPPGGTPVPPEDTWVRKDIERAGQLRREVAVVELPAGDVAEQLVRLAEEQDCDVVIIGLPSESSPQQGTPLDTDAIVRHASCWVCLVSWPMIPREAEVEPLRSVQAFAREGLSYLDFRIGPSVCVGRPFFADAPAGDILSDGGLSFWP